MDFSSVPLYLDPPPNWNQQSNHHHHQISNNNNNGSLHQQHLLSLPIQPQLPSAPPGGGGVSSIRRGSMADRARMANAPIPETALKCPRCDSTNTKFCYFNNYNLSQPRHFCKTCRRYWTRGGALRNVPVGGGCRRNKKNKTRNRSKSPAARNTSNSPTATTIPQLSFMAANSLNNFSRYGSTNLGLNNLNEIQGDHHPHNCNIQNGTLILNNHQNINPLLDSIETPMGLLYPFQIMSEGGGRNNTTNSTLTSNSRATHLPQVKIEETQVLNLLKASNFDANINNQFWSNGNGSWTDVTSAINSSSGHVSCNFNH